MCTALTFQTPCVHLMSCNLNIISIRVSSKTSKTLGCARQHRYRCRRFHWWCTWVWRLTGPEVCVCCVHVVFMSFFVFGSGSGATGMCSHRIGKDSGFLRSTARPSAAARQPWLQSGDHLSNQRASQPGTQYQVLFVARSQFSVWIYTYNLWHKTVHWASMKDSYHCCHEKQTVCLLCICVHEWSNI